LSRALVIAECRGGSYVPYILLLESQNLLSDRQGSCQRIFVLIMRITPKTKDQRFLRGNKNMAVKGRTLSQYYILVFANLLILCRFSVCGFFNLSMSSSGKTMLTFKLNR